jgi:ABC-type Na+ efflux pump permease subunit
MGAIPHATPASRGDLMRGKQIAITAVIALVVVVGFNTYQAKKQG